jgi:hypothetical protein
MTNVDHGSCPNCQSKEMILLPSGIADGYNKSGVHVGAFRSVSFARLICLQCGLVREWVASRKDLDLLRKKYGRAQRSEPNSKT